MKKFEYDVFYEKLEGDDVNSEDYVKALNELGEDGWEVVSIREKVSPAPFAVEYWFTCKREKTIDK